MTSKGITDTGASILFFLGTAAMVFFGGLGLEIGQPGVTALGVLLGLILNTAGIIRWLRTPLVRNIFRGGE